MIEVRHEILEQSYEGLKQAMDLQAKTAHDLKNHLNILYKYMEEKDTESAKAYIEDIRQPFLAKNEEHFTGNELIDFILNVKAQEAEKRHITMKVETRIGRVGLSDRELNSLLSNLLDNAVEAAQKGEEGERFVEVWMKTVRQMFILKIRNSYTEPVQKRGAHFVTSKEDKKRHGLGLEIVRDIVEKYDGSFQVSFHEKVFQVLIEIPMEE